MTILARIVGAWFVFVGAVFVIMTPFMKEDFVIAFMAGLFVLVAGILLLRAKKWEPEDVENLFRRRK